MLLVEKHVIVSAGVISIAFVTYLLVLSKQKHDPIPKIIWTYWDDPLNMPLNIRACLDTWRKHNPGYRIIVVSDKTMHLYCSPGVDSKQYVRLDILARHGGFWLDASVACTQSFDSYQRKVAAARADLFAYCPTDLIELWFLACPENSKFMRAWRDEVFKDVQHMHASAATAAAAAKVLEQGKSYRILTERRVEM